MGVPPCLHPPQIRIRSIPVTKRGDRRVNPGDDRVEIMARGQGGSRWDDDGAASSASSACCRCGIAPPAHFQLWVDACVSLAHLAHHQPRSRLFLLGNPIMSETYTIGAVCAEFNVTPRALRFYESKGLLSPIREGQRRLFTRRDLARLKLILRVKNYGFALSEMKELLDLYDVDHDQVTQRSATLEAAVRRHEEMIEERDELIAAIAGIEQDMAQIREMLARRGVSRAAE